eukprot:7598299-Prorocentrum_lima.AAC.1
MYAPGWSDSPTHLAGRLSPLPATAPSGNIVSAQSGHVCTADTIQCALLLPQAARGAKHMESDDHLSGV